MKEYCKFYKCPVCGKIIEVRENESKNLSCCGVEMELMTANTTDASVEKHVPVYEIVNDEIIVRVGETSHPMEEDHYIEWIALVSSDDIKGVQLHPGQNPEAKFSYVQNACIYAYCNKHGLWMTVIK